ncbi:hypothetical protein [Streptosporangium carneum]|uniref:Uncharacterized protein n=1 Tax=Streptosporangium carneum TaxID=47481 RepID=A0A9W6I2M4_9ACTN|nr:hypothetical protein [Streptosporangium carneum]GLK10907.1 hypothetical protein GCM10017600_43130 [Streptosporangium carneum]
MAEAFLAGRLGEEAVRSWGRRRGERAATGALGQWRHEGDDARHGAMWPRIAEGNSACMAFTSTQETNSVKTYWFSRFLS